MSNHSRTLLTGTSHFSKETLRLNPGLRGPVSPNGDMAKVEKSNTKIKGTKVPNHTEQRMLDLCEARKRRGEIDSYRYEGMTLRWGRDPKTGKPMRYTADVVVTVKDGYHDGQRSFDWTETTLIEVKGKKIWDRDLVRFKGCRAEWPEYHFEMWQWKDRQWTRTQ